MIIYCITQQAGSNKQRLMWLMFTEFCWVYKQHETVQEWIGFVSLSKHLRTFRSSQPDIRTVISRCISWFHCCNQMYSDCGPTKCGEKGGGGAGVERRAAPRLAPQ